MFSNNVSVLQSVSAAPNSLFYNVQRLLIQEKGEDIYYAIAQSKRQTLVVNINDRIYRANKAIELEH